MKRLETVLGIGLGMAIAGIFAMPANARKPNSYGMINTRDAQFLALVNQTLDNVRNPLIEVAANEKIEDARAVCRALDEGINFEEWTIQLRKSLDAAVKENRINLAERQTVGYYWGVVGAAGVYFYCPSHRQGLENFLAQVQP